MRSARLIFLISLTLLAAACGKAASTVHFSPGASPSGTPTASVSIRPGVMPNVMFISITRADQILEGLHLHVTHRLMTTIAYQPTLVVAQSPQPGAPIRPGQQVGLVVSVAPTCDPSYPTVCIQPVQPHLSCRDIPYKNFPVIPPDDDGLDGDHDGIGCERAPHSP
jgi:hypothetical protein